MALILSVASLLYIHLRWRRSPRAYRAMLVLACCYFAAGAIAGISVIHLTASRNAQVGTATSPKASTTAIPTPLAPSLNGKYTGPTFSIPPLHYDPAHAALPDPKLTPGDTFPGVTAGDVCTPGCATDHRHVTESMRDRVYAEYGRTRGPGCCEVDHLIPLELGGTNDLKNLWPQPDDPRPGSAEKDQLENELHEQVCAGRMTLADAQHCIASNWG